VLYIRKNMLRYYETLNIYVVESFPPLTVKCIFLFIAPFSLNLVSQRWKNNTECSAGRFQHNDKLSDFTHGTKKTAKK
jgi:hypothetical protein